ncbi:zinc-ribbon domain-containing protein [Croceicoccus sp. Ery15]|uniref:zinc-ribbon domain-containing protein n=1 Tax=Croceicoccus sp. Ery15 TaxID=1703338 RepID=UPI001E4A8CDF|nr:zinc-ribbon domain-containing protein [Croceicoccus sp. Ery15]
MRVTCSQCDKAFSIPSDLVGGDGRAMRCGECGSRWWQDGDGSTMVAEASSRTLVVTSDGRYREEHHRFTSFFDGISNRFSAQPDDAAGYDTGRFQRLKHSRAQRRHREANAIVEAEYKEIRDFGHIRDWCRMWLPRMAVIALFLAVPLILFLAP